MSSKGKKRADAGQGDLAVQGSNKKAKKAEKAADHDDTEDSGARFASQCVVRHPRSGRPIVRVMYDADGDDDASEVQVEFEHYDPQV